LAEQTSIITVWDQEANGYDGTNGNPMTKGFKKSGSRKLFGEVLIMAAILARSVANEGQSGLGSTKTNYNL